MRHMLLGIALILFGCLETLVLECPHHESLATWGLQIVSQTICIAGICCVLYSHREMKNDE